MGRRSKLSLFNRIRSALIGLSVSLCLPSSLQAQNTAPILDKAPFASMRYEALSGAVSPIANEIDAPFHNPAGIGGISYRKKSSGAGSGSFHFPYMAASVNSTSQELYQQFEAEGGNQDMAVGQAIIEAHAGKRQFARISFVPSLTFGRTWWGLISDQQLAAVPVGDNSGLVDTLYRHDTGYGGGMSFPFGRKFYLGLSAAFIQREEARGRFAYSDMIDHSNRRRELKANTFRYSGLRSYFGMTWIINEKGAVPSLALVLKDAGKSTFKAQGDYEDISTDENLSLAFALSPAIGKWMRWHFVTQADRLSDTNVSLIKKYQIGTEFLIGNPATKASLALRAGYRHAGTSAGLALRLGLLQLEFATSSVDVATGNQVYTDRRQSFSLAIDLGKN